MEIRNLVTFIKVAEEQSLSKAAKQLGYAQSTITMQMQHLEQELGVTLYERVGKQIRITEQGEELLTYAAQIVKTSQEALQIGKGKQKRLDGTLRLGITDALPEKVLVEQIYRYRRQYSEVTLNVRSGDGETLTRMLLHNEIDLMTVLDYRIQDEMLVHAYEREQAVHFVAAPDHPLARQKELQLSEILQYELIRGNLGISYERSLARILADEGLVPNRQTEIENRILALGLVLAGEGITLVPDSVVKDYLQKQQLIKLDYELPGLGVWNQTIYHKNKWLTGAMKAWIRMLEDTDG